MATSICEHCRVPFQRNDRGRPARYCGSTCRTAAWRARQDAAGDEETVVVATGNADAYEAAAARWDGAPGTLVELGRTLAAQVDADPSSASLARAYHRVLDDLESRTLAPPNPDLDAAVASLRGYGR